MGIELLERALLRPDWCVSLHLQRRPSSYLSNVAESLIDQAIALKCIGGVYGNQRPTEFLCLLLKLLQLQPEKEILIEYLQADEFK